MKHHEFKCIHFRMAVPVVIGLLSGLCLQAQTPTYWLATVERTPTATTYTYNVQAPDYFVPWLLETTARGGGRPINKTIDGKTYTLVPQFFAWDTKGSAPARTGQIRLDNQNSRMNGIWKSHDKLKTDQTLIRLLDSAATPTMLDSPWRYADLLALRWDGAGAPSLKYSEPIPELTQLMNRMVSFNDAPMKQGVYFPTVKIPSDLLAFQALMWSYGNAGRRDPDFRKNRPEPKTATDLSGPTVNTLKGQEKVFKQNPVPPYFARHAPNEKLNAAAQFQAEYIAFTNQLTHDGPKDYRDPASGKIVDMSGAWLRAEFFGAGRDVVEAAGLGGPGDYPEGWLHSDTHFRPWFNVDGCYPEIGYGAAMLKRGTWALVAVPIFDRDCSKSAATPKPAAVSITTQATPPFTQTVSGDSFPLRAGTAMVQGRKYRSESGKHYLVFQPDGNLVVYTAANQFVWGLNTVAPKYSEAKSVALQTDGNLVVNGPNRSYIWSALSRNPDPSAYLTIAPEGVLRLVSGKSGATLWASDNNLSPVYPLSGAAGSGSDKGQPGPTPQKSSPLTLNFNAQYAIRQPDGTFRYFQSVRNRQQGNKFQACPQPASSNEITLYSLDAVMRVEDALAQGFTASGQPCDVNQVPFGK
jgi:hypothetical protein